MRQKIFLVLSIFLFFIPISLAQNYPPTISNLKEPTDPSVYGYYKIYEFNATVCDEDGVNDINVTLFEFDNKNYTVTNYEEINTTCREYYYDISSLSAGSYNYRWIANDTSGTTVSTDWQSFTVSKATPSLTLSITPSWSVTYPTTVKVKGSENNLGDADVNYSLFRNGSLIPIQYVSKYFETSDVYEGDFPSLYNGNDTNWDSRTGRCYAEGGYKCWVEETWYLEDTEFITGVAFKFKEEHYNGNRPSVYFWNHTSNSWTLFPDQPPTHGAEYKKYILTYQVPEDGIGDFVKVRLYQKWCWAYYEGGLYVNWTYTNVEEKLLGAGIYNYTFNSTEGQNYTSYSVSQTLTVNKGILNLSLTVRNVTYPYDSLVIASENNIGDSDVTYELWKNNKKVSEGKDKIYYLFSSYEGGIGEFIFRFNSTGGANWTTNSSGVVSKLYVNKGVPNLVLEAEPSWTVIYPTQTKVSGKTSKTIQEKSLTDYGTKVGNIHGFNLAFINGEYKLIATSRSQLSTIIDVKTFTYPAPTYFDVGYLEENEYVNGYVWSVTRVSSSDERGILLKLSPVDLSVVETYNIYKCVRPSTMSYCGGYLWIGCYGNATLVRVNLTDMNITYFFDTFKAHSMSCDNDKWLFGGKDIVFKLNVSNPSEYYTLGIGDFSDDSDVSDEYYYFCQENSGVGVRVNKSDLTYSTVTLGDNPCYGAFYDDRREKVLFVIGNTTVGKIIEFGPDFTNKVVYEFPDYPVNELIVFNSTYYLVDWNNPATLRRFSPVNLGDSDLTYNLYRNDSLVSNPDVGIREIGIYVYKFNTSGGENYTMAEIEKILNVQAYISITLNFTSLDFGTLDVNTTNNPEPNNGINAINVSTNCDGRITFYSPSTPLTYDSYTIPNSNFKLNYTINTTSYPTLLTLDQDRVINVTDGDIVRPYYYLDIPDYQHSGTYSTTHVIEGWCA